MKKKNRKVLLSGSSTLLVSSLIGSSVPVNVNAGGKEILGWISANFWDFVTYIGSIFTSSDSDVKKNSKDGIRNNSNTKKNDENSVDTEETLSKKEKQEQLKVSEEQQKKQELLKKEKLKRVERLVEKLKERLGDKIQLSPDEKKGCYSGKIKFSNSVKLITDITVKYSDYGKFSVIFGCCCSNLCGVYYVQSNCKEEEKIDNVINYVVDWYRGAEARLKKLDELAGTGKFDLVKDSDTRFVKLCPKNNLKLRIVDEDNGLEGVAGTVAYNVVTDKLSFYYDRNLDMYSHSAVSGFIELSFRSNDLKKGTDEKEVSKNLSIFDRFVSQLKSNKNANNITFKVSGEESAKEDNQDFDAAELCG